MNEQTANTIQAFPGNWKHSGMSLRDYFAAKVLQGLLSSPRGDCLTTSKDFAEHSYAMADAMLKVRNS